MVIGDQYMANSNFPISCWGGWDVADVHPFHVSPMNTPIKLDRRDSPTRFLVYSLRRATRGKSSFNDTFNVGRVRSLIAPSAKSSKQFPQAFLKDSPPTKMHQSSGWDRTLLRQHFSNVYHLDLESLKTTKDSWPPTSEQMWSPAPDKFLHIFLCFFDKYFAYMQSNLFLLMLVVSSK